MILLLLIFFVLILKNEKFFNRYHSFFLTEIRVVTQPLIDKTTENKVHQSQYGYFEIYKDSINIIF